MQNKGFVKVFAVLLTLACIFYLSFSFVTRYQMNKAEKDPKGAEHYLDSMQNQKVWLGIYTLKQCREMEIGLGLDLKGGMNVILEVSVSDVVKALADNKPDEAFNKAVAEAAKLQVTSQEDFITLFVREYKKLVPDGKLAELMVGAHIRRILVYIYRECSMHEEGLPAGAVTIVSRAMNYMNKNFTRAISLDEIANVSMVSKDHLSHIFSRTTGSGIKQYLINLRINHAKFLLCESDRNISEVAEACGYEDVNYFSRQFRNAEGMSPRDFRRMVHERPAYDNG